MVMPKLVRVVNGCGFAVQHRGYAIHDVTFPYKKTVRLAFTVHVHVLQLVQYSDSCKSVYSVLLMRYDGQYLFNLVRTLHVQLPGPGPGATSYT